MHTKKSDTCYFADGNVEVSGGVLTLANRREQSHGFNYTSGVVNSISYGTGRGFQQTYGPAFWLPNTRNNGDDGNCEIDVVEIPGNPKFGGGATAWGTVHSTHDSYANGSAHGNVTLPAGEWWGDAFHDFAVWWAPGFIAWYIDGVPFFNTTKYVPHTPAYMVLDNEIGLGHLAGPGGGWAGNPAHTPFPQLMLVDHVQVWRLASSEAALVPARR